MKKLILLFALVCGFAVPGLAQQEVEQSSTSCTLGFTMISSSDHIAGKTGLSGGLTIYLSKDGASAVTASGSVTEVSSSNMPGYYTIPCSGNSGTFGVVHAYITGAGADPLDKDLAAIVGFNPRSVPSLVDVENQILNALTTDHTTAGTYGKKIGDNTPQTGDNYARLGAPAGASVSADIAAINTNVAVIVGGLVIRFATAQAGGASTITLDSGASATDNLYSGNIVTIASGTGAGQTRTILSYVGSTKVATVNRAWATNPSSSSVFSLVAP